MADAAHVKKLKEGVRAWNAWRRDNPDVVPDLSGFGFGGMDVSGANIRQAGPRDAQHDSGVNLRRANLRGAQLGGVTGLLPASLAGADLTRAELPSELSDFPALAHVAEVSRQARVSFLAVVMSCGFCMLTIVQIADGTLIATGGEALLPDVGTKVPVTIFFLIAPAILLTLYIYLQLYLQRMWDGLSRLPAVFPDGSRLDQKAFPWLLSGLISLYVPGLQKGAPPFAWLQFALSSAAVWGLVPATIAGFWLRYLLVTNELGIVPLVILLALAIAIGVLFFWRADVTLRGGHPPPRRAPFAGRLPALTLTAPLIVLAALLGASVTDTYGLRFGTALWHLKFTGEEITGDANPDPEAIKKQKLLDLTRLGLRHAEGQKAILYNVSFRKVDLSFSNLSGADLRWADLIYANLTDARLVGAKLEGVLLDFARLDGADFTGATGLTDQMLLMACGERVDLPFGLSVKPCPDARATDGETKVTVRAYEREPGAVFQDCDECPEMVVVPAGEFLMGLPEDEGGLFGKVGPQQGVRIAAPFAIGRYEVTLDQFDVFVRATERSVKSRCWNLGEEKWEDRNDRSYRTPGISQSGDHPVVCVNWYDALAYVEWLSKETGKGYRLPSEAEWEYAARAGTTTAYNTGSQISAEQANFDNDVGTTSPVGSYPANAFKVHDIHGNAWEWTSGCWSDGFSSAAADGTAWMSSDCTRRVIRGGSWIDRPAFLRSAYRARFESGTRNFSYGFRIARTLTP